MRTGLFFGSFNPIHTGHLIIAQYILDEAKLDRIKFVISPHNPLKEQKDLIDYETRLKMVELSIADNPSFETEAIEYTLPLPSYTVQTLAALEKAKTKNETFHIIMGSDNMETIEKWKNFDTILSYPVLIYKRNQSFINHYHDNKNIRVFDSPILNISASRIRQMLEINRSVKYLVRDEIISILKRQF
jgi:nicotinate-nucleotide adenylyltransferase